MVAGSGTGSFVEAARTSLAKVMLSSDGSKSRVVALTDLWWRGWWASADVYIFRRGLLLSTCGPRRERKTCDAQVAKVGHQRVDVCMLAGPGSLAMDGGSDEGQRVFAARLDNRRGVQVVERYRSLPRPGVRQSPLELFYPHLQRGNVAGQCSAWADCTPFPRQTRPTSSPFPGRTGRSQPSTRSRGRPFRTPYMPAACHHTGPPLVGESGARTQARQGTPRTRQQARYLGLGSTACGRGGKAVSERGRRERSWFLGVRGDGVAAH